MKSKFSIPVIALAAVGAVLFFGSHASARQRRSSVYYWPNNAPNDGVQVTPTCRTGWPDYDTNCTNGDRFTIWWHAWTAPQGISAITGPINVRISPGDHAWGHETVYCGDGTTLSCTWVDDNICGWQFCESDVPATRIELSAGIHNNPS